MFYHLLIWFRVPLYKQNLLFNCSDNNMWCVFFRFMIIVAFSSFPFEILWHASYFLVMTIRSNASMDKNLFECMTFHPMMLKNYDNLLLLRFLLKSQIIIIPP